MDRGELKEKIQALVAQKRKRVEGRPNIEGVSKPHKMKPHSPGQVSIGAHGGRYVQEPSGHKRYVAEGSLSGVKRFKKSETIVKSLIEEFVQENGIHEFIENFRKEKARGR